MLTEYIQLTKIFDFILKFHHWWFPHEESNIEREGCEEADVQEDDDHKIPLAGDPRPHQVLLQLQHTSINNIVQTILCPPFARFVFNHFPFLYLYVTR